jgi:hypothetical protein
MISACASLAAISACECRLFSATAFSLQTRYITIYDDILKSRSVCALGANESLASNIC